MNSLEVNRAINAIIKEKIPAKRKMVGMLSEILDLDRKAIYRRLNDEVFFSFSEICKLSWTLGISVDRFILKASAGIAIDGVVSLPESPEYADQILNILTKIKETVSRIAGHPDSEMGNITSHIPSIFYCYDKELLLFSSYFKNCREINHKSYSEFKTDPTIRRFLDASYETYQEYRNMRHYCMLMTRSPVKPILEEMNYLRKIQLLTDQEYDNLKGSVANFLTHLEKTVETGTIGNTDANCSIYLSDIDHRANCHYFWCPERSFSSLQMYLLGMEISFDQEHNEKMRNWLDVWRNNSVLITKSNINERIHFFANQYKILEQF